MIKAIKRKLFWKMFLSYLVIVLIWLIVLAIATPLTTQSAFDHHMSEMMSGGMSGMMGERMMESMNFYAFQDAINEIMTIGTLISLLVAVVISGFLSFQMVSPVRRITAAAQRISEGNYNERVKLPEQYHEDDLDELGQLSLRFNQMAESLEQTESMRRQLIGDVAHELRTPLTIIGGSMEGLIDGILPAEPQTFEQIQREAKRLQRLVADLQELSRADGGAYVLDRRPMEIAELVQTLQERIGSQFVDKNVALEIDLPCDLSVVSVDEDRIGQVLLNLVGNALQYTPEGGNVWLSANNIDDAVEISVKDTGSGLSQEHLPHVFIRFYRVDKSRSRAGGGSGIGLTLAKYFIEAHGGEISVSSRGVNQGSTFTFTLPKA
jgi:signal transduction histidine kinase